MQMRTDSSNDSGKVSRKVTMKAYGKNSGSDMESHGIVRKLWHHWLSGNRTGVHLIFGCLFTGIYVLAGLIASSMESFPLEQPMKAVGFAGLFVTMLLVLLHANLHGSNQFLKLFEDTGHLPVRQLTAVCSFCMILFLGGGAVFMAGLSVFLPFLWRIFCRWLEGRRVYADPEAAANLVPDMNNHTPDLAAVAGEVHAAPAWVRLAEQLIFAAGYIMMAVIVFFMFWQLARFLYRLFSRPVRWDDDVRISLRPDYTEDGTKAARTEKFFGKMRRMLFHSADPREKIREQYRRAVRNGLKKQKQAQKNSLCSSTPEELEQYAGISDPELHNTYEKARYDGRTVLLSDFPSS